MTRNVSARRWLRLDQAFTTFSNAISAGAGKPTSFVVATLVILIWAITGPVFHWSDTWQLIINTGTTIVTFLMVFVIQNSQNRDGAAMQAKLDELLRAVDNARERFVGIEHLTDEQIGRLREALEREVGQAEGKQSTADDTVEHLLERR